MSNPTVLSPAIRGLTYPLTVDKGNLATSTDYALVTQHIGDFVLGILDPGQINSSIQYSILQNVSGLTDLSVVGDWMTGGEDGLYRILIQYAVNGVPQPPLNFTLAN